MSSHRTYIGFQPSANPGLTAYPYCSGCGWTGLHRSGPRQEVYEAARIEAARHEADAGDRDAELADRPAMEQEIDDKMRCYPERIQERYGHIIRSGIETKYATRRRNFANAVMFDDLWDASVVG